MHCESKITHVCEGEVRLYHREQHHLVEIWMCENAVAAYANSFGFITLREATPIEYLEQRAREHEASRMSQLTSQLEQHAQQKQEHRDGL